MDACASGYTVGVDVGGTKTAYGLFDGGGEPVSTLRRDSDATLGPEEFFDNIVTTIGALCRDNGVGRGSLRGVGIGMPSFILFDEGRIVKTANLIKIKDFQAKDYLVKKLGGGVGVVLDNDARANALAEHRRGAGRGFPHMLFCPVSTGISSGIIIGGKPFRGTYGWSGESGHMIATPGEGLECGCGNRGCYMSWCSGSMIVRHVQNWIDGGQQTLMTSLAGGSGGVTAVHISEAFGRGDPMAIRAVEQMAKYMSVWIFNLYMTFNINCFVFGGGLLGMKVGLMERVRALFDAYNKNDMPVYFKTAELGEYSGVIGAAELLKD